jgi:putative ABC transport system substrate-binding protein
MQILWKLHQLAGAQLGGHAAADNGNFAGWAAASPETGHAMKKRDIIAAVGFMSAAGLIAAAMITSPWGARAHRDGLPVIGFLNVQPSAAVAPYMAAFRDGLEAMGYAEGREVVIEYRFADGDDQKARMLAWQFAARRVAVIAVIGGLHSAHAIPGVPAIPSLLVSRARPAETEEATGASARARNLASLHFDLVRMAAKRLELLRELIPSGGRLAILVGAHPAVDWRSHLVQSVLAQSERKLAESQGAAVLRAGNPQDFERELDAEFEGAVRSGVRGFVVGADPFFSARRGTIVALAAKHGLAALYPWRDYVEEGGLASYGPDLVDLYHQIGMYTGQILKGARPGDEPVVSPRKWDLVINRKAAASLRLAIPPWLIARANEVID